MTPTSESAVIEVKASFIFLAFLLYFFKPQAAINGGAPFAVTWGSTPVPVPPGRYQVEVWVPYLFYRNMGRNGVVVDVPAGTSVQVAWRAPWLAFLQGKISVAGPQPAGVRGSWPGSGGALGGRPQSPPAPAGDWHPDPSGRHEHRYYDGTAWTEHVVDGAVQGTDPVDA